MNRQYIRRNAHKKITAIIENASGITRTLDGKAMYSELTASEALELLKDKRVNLISYDDGDHYQLIVSAYDKYLII